MTRGPALLAMAVGCGLLLGGLLYLRLGDPGGLARASILVASIAMALLMVRVVGAGRGGR